MCFLLSFNGVRADEPEKRGEEETEKPTLVQQAKQKIAATAGDDYEKFRVGGYGEVVNTSGCEPLIHGFKSH